MMKFLFVDFEAIKTITSGRQYQTSTFQRAENLLHFFKGLNDSYEESNLYGFRYGSGVILSSKGSKLNQGVFYDLTHFNGFSDKPDSQIISHFQKVLKFALRLWTGNVFSFSEKILDNNKAIIFGNSFAVSDSQYKILIDRNPLAKRLDSRDFKIIQVYSDGYEQMNIEPSYENLKEFITNKSMFYSSVVEYFENTSPKSYSEVTPLAISSLEKSDYTITGALPFDQWLTYLTKAQKEFITTNRLQTMRLEGAAGTGKTLSLILKAIYILKQSIEEKRTCRIIFLTHSGATKKQIKENLLSISPELKNYVEGEFLDQLIEITTLSDWCVNHLGTTLNETQLLERDAQDSKTHQYLLLEEIFESVMSKDYNTYKSLVSKEFRSFLEDPDRHIVLEMLQFEIGVSIKGKAEENFDKYLDSLNSRSKYNIPAKNKHDLDFVYIIYNHYRDRLNTTDQYDVDDIVLTSLGILRTPIWRRRKNIEGYDLVIVDETHLFNFNELAVFHYLLKDTSANNIIFAIDKTQAVGDRGLTDEILEEQLNVNTITSNSKYNTVFRSSPQIIDLAYSILSSGATLFRGVFANPLDLNTEFTFTSEDEAFAKKPQAIALASHEKMIEMPFELAEKMAEEMKCSRSQILIIGCSDIIVDELNKEAKKANKPVELLVRRADNETIKYAAKTNRFVLASIDFVGGLEFLGVILVGVDKGRVPPNEEHNSFNFHFVNYAWHNRLYVAVTRAKYRLIVLYENAREISNILTSAKEKGILEV